MSEQQVISERCSECGSTARERVLGIQVAEMLAGASERAKQEAKPDDPVAMLRRLAREFGYELTRCTCGSEVRRLRLHEEICQAFLEPPGGEHA